MSVSVFPLWRLRFSFCQWQIKGETRPATSQRFQFHAGPDRLRPILHDVDTETAAAVRGRSIETNSVVSDAKNEFAFSSARFQNNFCRACVFVGVDHAF